jgi:transposase-like protein
MRVKTKQIAEQAATMYVGGLSIEAVAKEMGIAYRTARKAILSRGVELRNPSERLVGRTRPDKKKA